MDIRDWFTEKQKTLAIDVEEIGLSNMRDWRIIEENGAPHHIGHTSGRFHRGVFLRAWDIFRKEWIERFLIAPIAPEDGDDHYGVALLAKFGDQYLVQAKAEPGNATPGHVQLTTTIQASNTNKKMQLSGAIAFVEFNDDPRRVQFTVSQDGAQLYLKKNVVCFLELTERPATIPEDFAWATLSEIRAFAEEGLASEHIMQCLGVERIVNKGSL